MFGLKQFIDSVNLSGEPLTVMLICAGQKDCLSIYGGAGIRAISLQSETALLTEGLYNKIRPLAEHIFVCYDNDSTGRENSAKIHSAYGIPIMDISIFTDQNDISDYFKYQMKGHGEYKDFHVPIHTFILSEIKKVKNFVFNFILCIFNFIFN